MKYPDLIKTTTTSTGTGNITVAATAPAGFQAFMSGLAVNDTFGYKIGDPGAGDFETGIGTVVSANVFSRSPETSSNGNALVNLAAGTKTVIASATGGLLGKMASATAMVSSTIPDPATWTMPVFDAAGVPRRITFNDMLASMGSTVADLTAAASLAGADVVTISQNGGATEVRTTLTAIAAYVASTLSTPATAVTMSGPSSGTVGVASSSFTVGANGVITGTVVVTPSDGGAGGTFTPTTRSISSGSPTGTFTYTPASTGGKTISVTNNGSLTNPTSIPYTSNAAGDTTAPTASLAAVANSTPTIVAITMSEAMDTSFVPAASAFTVGGHTVSSVGISGSTINLTCSAAFVNGEAARTVAYTQPGTNNARDIAGNLLANFTALAITNNVAGGTVYTITGYSGNGIRTAPSDTTPTSTQGTLRGFQYAKTMTVSQYFSVTPTPPNVGGSTVKAGWNNSSTVAPAEITTGQNVAGSLSVNGLQPITKPSAAYIWDGWMWVTAGSGSTNWYFWLKPSDGPAQCMNPGAPLVMPNLA